MLLRFRVRNHLSLRDEEEISLVASSLDDDASGLIPCDAAGGQKLLPAVVLYGANASGKSNLVASIEMMRSHILLSHREGELGGGVPRESFALDPDIEIRPSAFDADFIMDGIRYNYGFESTDQEFISEWLYTYPKGVRRTLFKRTRQDFEFGRALKGHNRIIAESTRTNSLFLSTASQMNHAELSQVVGFFKSLKNVRPEIADSVLAVNPDQKAVDSRIVAFLNNIGTGICDIRISDEDRTDDDRKFASGLKDLLEELINKKIPDNVLLHDRKRSVEFAHRSCDGGSIFFDIHQESEGTRRLAFMLISIYHALDNGTGVLIDELNAHLHTQACEAVLALFCDPKTNPKGAQLIATTHDTNLLRSQYLRRDQVWFAEKDREGATHIYPLTDIRTRKGDNIEKGYLQGRYGAVPFSGSVSHLTKG